MASSHAGQPVAIGDLFYHERWPTCTLKRLLLMLYAPFGMVLVIFRMCIGIHIFLTACVLRKTMLLRCAVLRVMSCILGVVVYSRGPASGWDRKTKLIIANHVTSLDHVAIDLIEPCILPSVWDIPDMLTWLLGYADLGAREGRNVFIRKARAFCESNPLPLLAFPEGAMTNGQKGLLKFSSWPFEVSDIVQPVLITVHRPLFGELAPSVLGGSWWQDVLYFLFVPCTVIKVSWLPPIRRQMGSAEAEAPEMADDFAKRVASTMASRLGLVATNLTCQDAVDEAKRHLQNRRRRMAERASMALNSSVSLRNITRRSAKSTSAQLDGIAMKIKQAFPAISLLTIRDDLDKTLDGNITCERIAKGVLKDPPEGSLQTDVSSLSSDTLEWRRTFNRRKWNMIETNRAKYLQRMDAPEEVELRG